MSIRYTSRSWFWILPFVAFIGGYSAIRLFFASACTQVPAMVGLTLAEAAKIASQHHLCIQVVAEKVDEDLKPGVVISQTPLAFQQAKQRQIVYLVISKKPDMQKAPAICGKLQEQAIQELVHRGIPYKIITLQMQGSPAIVMAQQPAPGQPLAGSLILYRAESQRQVILPDFRAKLVSDVQSFLERHNIPYELQPQGEVPYNAVVEQQRPLPGTIISRVQPPTIQLARSN